MPSGVTKLMSSQCVPLFLREVRRHKKPVEALLAQHGLDAAIIDTPEATLPLRTVWKLCEDCAVLLGDPLLGFHVGTRLERGTYGLLEYVARSAPTLDVAFESLIRYSALLNPLVVFELARGKKGELTLTHSIPGVAETVGRQCNEYTVGIIVALARELVGADLTPTRVWLAHAEHEHAQALRDTLRCPVDFGRGANGMVLSAQDAARAIHSHDPALLKLMETQASRAAAERPKQGGSFTGQVHSLIRELLPTPGSLVEHIARRLHTTGRTLQRKLEAEGSSFQDMVEQTRSTLAKQWVHDGARPLGEVAYLLGYSDLRAFVRAYKRWTGTTPGVDRERVAG